MVSEREKEKVRKSLKNRAGRLEQNEADQKSDKWQVIEGKKERDMNRMR